MKKFNKTQLIITSVVILLPIIAGLIMWNDLPDIIATHWGADNQPNGFSSKAFAVFGIPAIILALHLLCVLGTSFDKRRENHNKKMLSLILWICPIISLLCMSLTYTYALGADVNIGFYILLFMGVLFIVMGNYLPKCRPNQTIGIKLPWTLNNDVVWNKTHRMAGPIWILGGIIITITAFLTNPWIVFGVIILMIVLPTVYAYIQHKKQ